MWIDVAGGGVWYTALQGKNLRFDAILGEDVYCHKGKRSVFERSVGVQN